MATHVFVFYKYMDKSRTISVRLGDSESPVDWSIMHSIRTTVFVNGQNVPGDLEVDEFDHHKDQSRRANHVIAFINDEPCGTARWRRTDKGWKLERFAVLSEFRGFGIGRHLVEFVLAQIQRHSEPQMKEKGDPKSAGRRVYLHAQEPVIGFYEKLGFQGEGEMFVEAGIRHRMMYYKE
eukprot:TRINITY_DN80596_c0_g1_i1.p1 TRINITY_DN80596_c0_g1~~TRINITY_DN80596_c0_g1_i1.p1  ORF type:complete len:179 (+),score=40.02 TRINITY_DN80596_c0_g1_i1:67-603(+)